MVELALVLPVFLLIVMGTIDFGWAFRSYIVATNAAREGARYGAIGAAESAIVDRVVDRSSGVLDADDVTVTNAQGDSGDDVTVSVSFGYEYITPLGGLLNLVSGGALPDPLPISSETVMRLE
jgi:Flp pilus assembly protein TadG